MPGEYPARPVAGATSSDPNGLALARQADFARGCRSGSSVVQPMAVISRLVSRARLCARGPRTMPAFGPSTSRGEAMITLTTLERRLHRALVARAQSGKASDPLAACTTYNDLCQQIDPDGTSYYPM